MGFSARGHVETIRTKCIKLAIVHILICSAMPLYGVIPWLHVESNRIKDPNGTIVVLRGVSLIDLGFLEGWQGGAINMISRLTNKNDTQGNSPGWHTKIIRIPICPADSVSGWPHRWTPGSDSFYNVLLRPVIDYCAQKDAYAIIDWHYIANTYDHVTTTHQFWQYMAPKFANDSHVMFELFNEPINDVGNNSQDWASVKSDMQQWVNLVRSYAPNNLILVGGPQWCQILAPQASNPIDGDNIVYVSHIYPAHWLSIYGSQAWFKNQIMTCAAVHPVMMTEWGFTTTSETLLNGTISNYGQPLMDFREDLGIGHTAWCASHNWGPPMFWSNWTLRCGEGEMGCFTKDILYQKRKDNQPGLGFISFQDFTDLAAQWSRADCGPSNAWCSNADLDHDRSVLLDDLAELVYYWLGGAE